ncbi:MAG TPA: hypothetical protein ENI17_05115 [Pseudomonas xinjiangensis]|uniref:Ig-like domain-containing protein n=2 Tax=root TaxID=1 RepID=A0A7V1BTN4_9GAMM|nr:hypothetical protein [Halopseudomonas xinjiangensis]HEC46992.1 hypothetical protein [Halopseudomonas xinjiangensis]
MKPFKTLCGLAMLLPAIALAAADVLLDRELNGLDIATRVTGPGDRGHPAAVPGTDQTKTVHISNNSEVTVTCDLSPEPAETAWPDFPEATIIAGGSATLDVGGDYSTETIRAKLVCTEETASSR